MARCRSKATYTVVGFYEDNYIDCPEAIMKCSRCGYYMLADDVTVSFKNKIAMKTRLHSLGLLLNSSPIVRLFHET